MQLQDYIKTMMLDFINKRSKMFNFKILKQFSRSIKLVQLLLKIYDQRKPLDIYVKDVMTLRNIAFERDKGLKMRYCKKSSTFLALKQFI